MSPWKIHITVRKYIDSHKVGVKITFMLWPEKDLGRKNHNGLFTGNSVAYGCILLLGERIGI